MRFFADFCLGARYATCSLVMFGWGRRIAKAKALFRLLLSSFWVAPAFELAFGLQESQRHEEALKYWLDPRQQGDRVSIA